MPTHSDGVAGLGFLELVQMHYFPLTFAISAILSSQFAEELSSGTMVFENLYYLAPAVIILCGILVIWPLLIFCPKLLRCRVTGMSDYMVMASDYVYAFDGKWIRHKQGRDEPLLGTPDLQSLADLTNSLNVVRGMRIAPVGTMLLREIGASALLPMLPLLLFRYPIEKLLTGLIRMLTGS
jgi:hypothetical protein